MMNTASLLGFVFGIVVACLVVWLVMRKFNTDGKTRTEYDERQKATRGVAYKYGFYSFVAYMIVLIFLDCIGVTIPAPDSVKCFTGIAIGVMVLCWYCIMHDAYWGLNNNVNLYVKFIIAASAINLIFGIIEIARGNMMVGGVLQNSFINLEAGILLALVGIVLIVKNIRDRKEEARR